MQQQSTGDRHLHISTMRWAEHKYNQPLLPYANTTVLYGHMNIVEHPASIPVPSVCIKCMHANACTTFELGVPKELITSTT